MVSLFQEWDMYTFIRSLIIMRSGVLGNKDQPICHSPPPSDNENELNFFVKYHFPDEQNKKYQKKTIKLIPDVAGKKCFRRLNELQKLLDDPEAVPTRTERAEARELRHKISLYMQTPREKEMLRKLKKLRWFFVKGRFDYLKKEDNNRIEWRTLPVYSMKKNSPFTHDEIMIMCVGNGNLHYIGKLTRREILLLTETAEEYHKNNLLNIDKDKVYILGTVIPFIKAIITLHVGMKMRVLNSVNYGNEFRKRFKYLSDKSNKAMVKAIMRDKYIKIKRNITCEERRYYAVKYLLKGGYKSDPFTFTLYLSGQLKKIKHLADVAVRVASLRKRVMKNFMFKMWGNQKLGRLIFRFVPTRDLAKLKTMPGSLFYNTRNTPYHAPRHTQISFYRVVKSAIEEKMLERQCIRRLMNSRDLLKVVRRLRKYAPISKPAFIGAMCAQIVNKCVTYMGEYRNTFRKITKVNKSIHEKKKLRLRGRRLENKYTMLARTVNRRLRARLANHSGFREETLAYNRQKRIKRRNRRRELKSKKKNYLNPSSKINDKQNISPLMSYKNNINNLLRTDDFQLIQDAIIRRYKTLVDELKEIQKLMTPKTLAKKKRRKKRKCYLVIRSLYRNLKMGKINSHRITKSLNVWRQFDAHIRNLMDDFNDFIENVVDSKISQWPPKKNIPNKHLFEFEKPKVVPKAAKKLNECSYNKKLRVLVNNKNKKILGGYRLLKLGTDWTSKYHEIIQRKFIKVEHFRQQKDSYVIQAGKMAAKGCEKVVKKCFYALKLFGIQKKDLELALLIYAKLRIMVKMELPVRYSCKDKLLEAGKFLDTKYQIYSEAVEQNRKIITKIKPQYISWRRKDDSFVNKVLVEHCDKPKMRIEKYFYGLDLRHKKSRKFIDKNDLFDLNDYKYYDYKSDDDFSNKLDYSSDSTDNNRIYMVDFCTCEEKEDPLKGKNGDNENNTGRRITKDIDLKELIHSDSIHSKEDIISIIKDHHMSLREESQAESLKNVTIESSPDLYTNSNNLHRNPKRHVLKLINERKHEKESHIIIVSSDNDSSSTSYDTKFRRSFFKVKQDMEKGIPDIMESDLRIMSRRNEKRKKLSLRIKKGGELRWRKTPKKLEDTFEKFLNFKLSHLVFRCHNYEKHFVPEYHPIYYLRHLPVIKELKDTPLRFSTISNFQMEYLEKFHKERFDPNTRRATQDLVSISSDSSHSLSLSNSGTEESVELLESDSLFVHEKLFVSKYDDNYKQLKGYDYLKLKEELRSEIENFRQLLRYEKECLFQNAHSNDVLMEIAERVENLYRQQSLLNTGTFVQERHSYPQCGNFFGIDPKEFLDYVDWIKTNMSHDQQNDQK